MVDEKNINEHEKELNSFLKKLYITTSTHESEQQIVENRKHKKSYPSQELFNDKDYFNYLTKDAISEKRTSTFLKKYTPTQIKRFNLKIVILGELLEEIIINNTHNKFLIGKVDYDLNDMKLDVFFKLSELPSPDYLQGDHLKIIPVYHKPKIRHLQSYLGNITKKFNRIDSFMLSHPNHKPTIHLLDKKTNQYKLSSYTFI